MEEDTNLIESLLEKAGEYGKTSYELVVLNVVDKTSDSMSSLFSHLIVRVFVICFVLFVSLGAAFWLGDVFGKIYIGFFAVAAFYGFLAFIIRVFMHAWIKRMYYDFFVRQMLR